MGGWSHATSSSSSSSSRTSKPGGGGKFVSEGGAKACDILEGTSNAIGFHEG